jgi:regulator of sigma D
MHKAVLLTKWLQQRQTLLVSLYDLCHHRPFFLKMQGEAFQEALQEFGGQILDYLSLGHFKLFGAFQEQLGHPFLFLVNQLNESTHQILNLKDRYQNHFNVIQLDRDLGYLSERLAKRFELEDRLISLCLTNKPARRPFKRIHYSNHLSNQ